MPDILDRVTSARLELRRDLAMIAVALIAWCAVWASAALPATHDSLELCLL